MKWTREEYIELMTFGRNDRQMFVELFGPLIGLEEEWKKQGATEAQINMTAFDWDYGPMMRCGGNTGLRGGFKPYVIQETAEHIICGYVFMPKIGKKSRLLSEILNTGKEFIAVKSCTLEYKLKPGKNVEKHEFMQVNVSSILLMRPMYED